MTETNPPADTRAADLLVADARRAVHESLTFLAAPEADRVRALIADLETAVEGRTAIRFTAATTPAFAPTHPLRDRLDTAIDGVFDRWKTGLGDQTPQDAVRDAVLAVLPAPTDRAALPVRPQTLAAIARHLEARAVTILRPDSEPYAEYHAVAAELRRLADAASGPGRAAGETQQDETQARRGDAVEAWLKAQRDAAADHPEAYQAVDGLLDQYRLHADTGTPLNEHVCEGRTVGDCDCLEPHLTPSGNVRVDHLLHVEQPAAVSQPNGEA
ncbi:hypothetical protein AB0C91_10330 [Streptomyces sp. NPDC048674]|uniref:hypothetical protein n=1 Tax=Streptomyces sp. NPDC048674 TaxID=3155491 RepID=UPI003420ABFF